MDVRCEAVGSNTTPRRGSQLLSVGLLAKAWVTDVKPVDFTPLTSVWPLSREAMPRGSYRSPRFSVIRCPRRHWSCAYVVNRHSSMLRAASVSPDNAPRKSDGWFCRKAGRLGNVHAPSPNSGRFTNVVCRSYSAPNLSECPDRVH